MSSPFREMVKVDRDAVFLNPEEFGDPHTIDGGFMSRAMFNVLVLCGGQVRWWRLLVMLFKCLGVTA